jgi:anti-sigma-K factor RskA
MMKRVLSLTAALAVMVFVTAAFAADAAKEKAAASTVTGTVAKTGADSISVTDKDGKTHELTVAKDAKIQCDGKDCKLADLTKGTMVTVTLNADNKTQADKIDAKTK